MTRTTTVPAHELGSNERMNCSKSSVQFGRTVRTVHLNWTELFEQFSSGWKNCLNSSRELNWTVRTVHQFGKISEMSWSYSYMRHFISSRSWAELFEQFSSVRKNCLNSSLELNWTVRTVQFSSEELFEQFAWAELNCSNSSVQFGGTVRTVHQFGTISELSWSY